MIEAKKKDDTAFFKRTLSPNFSLVGVDGTLLEGQEAAENLGDSDLVELTPYDMKVVTLADDAVVVTYDAIVREKPEEDQGPPPRYQHFSSVWVKQGDCLEAQVSSGNGGALGRLVGSPWNCTAHVECVS